MVNWRDVYGLLSQLALLYYIPVRCSRTPAPSRVDRGRSITDCWPSFDCLRLLLQETLWHFPQKMRESLEKWSCWSLAPLQQEKGMIFKANSIRYWGSGTHTHRCSWKDIKDLPSRQFNDYNNCLIQIYEVDRTGYYYTWAELGPQLKVGKFCAPGFHLWLRKQGVPFGVRLLTP